MGKLVCEGINKKCGASYGVHKFSVELRGGAQPEKTLCSSCRTTMERAGYTLSQLADVPQARVVNQRAPRARASIADWQSWIDKD